MSIGLPSDPSPTKTGAVKSASVRDEFAILAPHIHLPSSALLAPGLHTPRFENCTTVTAIQNDLDLLCSQPVTPISSIKKDMLFGYIFRGMIDFSDKMLAGEGGRTLTCLMGKETPDHLGNVLFIDVERTKKFINTSMIFHHKALIFSDKGLEDVFQKLGRKLGVFPENHPYIEKASFANFFPQSRQGDATIQFNVRLKNLKRNGVSENKIDSFYMETISNSLIGRAERYKVDFLKQGRVRTQNPMRVRFTNVTPEFGQLDFDFVSAHFGRMINSAHTLLDFLEKEKRAKMDHHA
jgi:hypothetical protein